jgi:DNA-binding MarR family transcriptional regulator
LLAQVGARASGLFAERLAATGLAPHHAGILRFIAGQPGVSQQTLASALGMFPSRLVSYLDELEHKALVERRENPEDRRLYALALTERGARLMAEIGRVARAHDDAVCAPLSAEERAELHALLNRLANHLGLSPGVHPGFAALSGARPRKQPARTRAPSKRRRSQS